MSQDAAQLAPQAPLHVLRRTVGRGLAWSLLNNLVGRAGTFVAGIVLARILSPADYGVFAVALVVITAGLSMNELGVSLAVVRWEEPISRFAPTVATLALAWSGVLYAVLYVAAPYIAGAMGSAGATPVIRVLGTTLLIDALATVPAALMMRHFMQRRRLVIDTVCLVVSIGVAIGLAVNGFGVWAIAGQLLASNALSSLMTMAWSPGRSGFGWNKEVIPELLAFGAPLAAASLLMFAMLNLDYVVVGHLLGPVELGIYLLAFNVCSWPVSLVSVAIRRVSFAAFSRLMEDSHRAGEGFALSAVLTAALVFPMCAGLGVYALPCVLVLYGTKWEAAASAIPWLCALALVRVMLELSYDFVAARGRGTTNMVLHGAWALLLLPAMIVGAKWAGISGVAIAHAAVGLALIVPAYAFVLAREAVPLGRLSRLSARPLVAAALVVACGVLLSALVESPQTRLLIGLCSSVVLSVAVLWPMRSLIAPALPKQAPDVTD